MHEGLIEADSHSVFGTETTLVRQPLTWKSVTVSSFVIEVAVLAELSPLSIYRGENFASTATSITNEDTVTDYQINGCLMRVVSEPKTE